jgi:uncharacterized protein
MSKEKFIESISKSYSIAGASIYLGAGVYQGEILGAAKVNLPLRMMNRHASIACRTTICRRRVGVYARHEG